MGKNLVYLMAGLALLPGCKKAPENRSQKTPATPVSVADSELGITLIDSSEKVPSTEIYSIKQDKNYRGDAITKLVGSGREYRKFRDKDGYLTEGIIGCWYAKEPVTENLEYSQTLRTFYFNEDNTLTCQKEHSRTFDSESNSPPVFFKTVAKSRPVHGTWKIKGNALEIKLTDK